MPDRTGRILVCMKPESHRLNPSHGLISAALRKTGKVLTINYRLFRSLWSRADIVHIEYPDTVLYPSAWPKRIVKYICFLSFIVISKALGRPIVWMANNIGSHEQRFPLLERLLWRIFLPRVDHVIHNCTASFDAIRNLTPSPPAGSLIGHAHHRTMFSALEPCVEPRRKLDLPADAFVLASYGLIRPYKGIEHLIAVMRSWNCPDAVLYYAGVAMDQELADKIRKLAEGDSRIRLDLRAVSNLELRDLIVASDVIVIPYTKIMNSGVAAAALSLARPILAPRAGVILDHDRRLGPVWVQTFEGELAVEDLERAYKTFRGRTTTAVPDLDWMDPDRIAPQIVEIYERLMQKTYKRKAKRV
jgi:beta-1,4-mannosyltransferase